MKYINTQRLVHTFLMSLVLSGAMSIIMFIPDMDSLKSALVLWPGRWLYSMLIAFTISLLLSPIANRISTKLTR